MDVSKCALICLSLAISSFIIPLIFIGFSIAFSGWFNLYENALSDLGHAVNSRVAFLFNFGLSLGGLLMIIFATKYIGRYNRILEYMVVIIGYALILVAVFDEIYGRLHFMVSVLFFTALLLLILIYALVLKSSKMIILASLLIVLNIIIWVMHFTIRMPKGAAIPELISIFSALPFYIHLIRVVIRYSCSHP